MSSRGCRLLLDTSVLWAGARGGERARALVGCLIGLRGKGCRVYWSLASLHELELEGSEEALQVAGWARANLGPPSGTGVQELLGVLGRYGKWVKRLGPADVMIVLVAGRDNAVLATADAGQARFYEDLTGRKPLFIPINLL